MTREITEAKLNFVDIFFISINFIQSFKMLDDVF